MTFLGWFSRVDTLGFGAMRFVGVAYCDVRREVLWRTSRSSKRAQFKSIKRPILALSRGFFGNCLLVRSAPAVVALSTSKLLISSFVRLFGEQTLSTWGVIAPRSVHFSGECHRALINTLGSILFTLGSILLTLGSILLTLGSKLNPVLWGAVRELGSNLLTQGRYSFSLVRHWNSWGAT